MHALSLMYKLVDNHIDNHLIVGHLIISWKRVGGVDPDPESGCVYVYARG